MTRPRDDNDDLLTGPVPDPDAEPTAAERAHARTFADVVDKTLAGRAPPAMSPDDRALIEVATVIRAAHGNLELPATKARAMIEDALRQAVGEAAPAAAAGSVVMIGPSLTASTSTRTRAPRRRWVPWTIATASTLIAAAAVLLLWIRGAPVPAMRAAAAAVPASWTSRPTDPLIGPIAREHAGDASDRIDYIFADRLDGYRERRLSRGGKR